MNSTNAPDPDPLDAATVEAFNRDLEAWWRAEQALERRLQAEFAATGPCRRVLRFPLGSDTDE